jgi:transposase
MTLLPRGVKVHLAFGFIDMRKGIDGLAMLVQGMLRQESPANLRSMIASVVK